MHNIPRASSRTARAHFFQYLHVIKWSALPQVQWAAQAPDFCRNVYVRLDKIRDNDFAALTTCYIIHGEALTKSSVSLATRQRICQNKQFFCLYLSMYSFFPRILEDGSYCLYVSLVWWEYSRGEKRKKNIAWKFKFNLFVAKFLFPQKKGFIEVLSYIGRRYHPKIPYL